MILQIYRVWYSSCVSCRSQRWIDDSFPKIVTRRSLIVSHVLFQSAAAKWYGVAIKHDGKHKASPSCYCTPLRSLNASFCHYSSRLLARSPSFIFIVKMHLQFCLVPLIFVLAANAVNDWTRPCFNGRCAHDLEASNSRAAGSLILVSPLFWDSAFSYTRFVERFSERNIWSYPSCWVDGPRLWYWFYESRYSSRMYGWDSWWMLALVQWWRRRHARSVTPRCTSKIIYLPSKVLNSWFYSAGKGLLHAWRENGTMRINRCPIHLLLFEDKMALYLLLKEWPSIPTLVPSTHRSTFFEGSSQNSPSFYHSKGPVLLNIIASNVPGVNSSVTAVQSTPQRRSRLNHHRRMHRRGFGDFFGNTLAGKHLFSSPEKAYHDRYL